MDAFDKLSGGARTGNAERRQDEPQRFEARKVEELVSPRRYPGLDADGPDGDGGTHNAAQDQHALPPRQLLEERLEDNAEEDAPDPGAHGGNAHCQALSPEEPMVDDGGRYRRDES